jgi:alanine-glyoxylate transaminase/serine-glyoxylate transaminase/serine-pyruvate transaminase
MGLSLFVGDKCASKTLTAVCLPKGIDGAVLRQHILDKHDIHLAGGLGETANTVIRVGHMAMTASAEYLIPTLQAIEMELLNLGAKIRRGVAVPAFKNGLRG